MFRNSVALHTDIYPGMHLRVHSHCSVVGSPVCSIFVQALLLLLQNVLWQLDDYLQSSKKAPADTSFRVEVCSVELHDVQNTATSACQAVIKI